MKSEGRTKNSIKNMAASLTSNFVSMIAQLISQSIFLKILNTEYLGLNSLFSNVLSMLAIVEMGIGEAIIFNLYKPIAENDTEAIKSLTKFYKKSYHIIGGIVFTIGIILIPFLPYIINEKSVNINVNLNIVYLLFLLDTVFSYFLSYKRSILYANQKNYIINIIHIGYIIIMNSLQLTMLYLTRNYYVYLIVKIAMRILENLIITICVNKKYTYLKEKNVKKLDQSIEKDIIKKVKALFLHKIGSFVVLGTDNIIISKFLGLAMVGMYNNYYIIINGVSTVISQIISATKASVGNLLVTTSSKKQFNVFEKIRFVNFWLSCFAATCILVLMEPFITVWIGKEYILGFVVLVTLVINFFIQINRSSYNVFKEAAGIYYEDRFVPIIESIVNIIASIIFVKICGLAGVFIGTIMSDLVLWLFSFPKFVYKKLFKRNYWQYSSETFRYFMLFIIIATITYSLARMVIMKNTYIELICKLIICIIVPNGILYAIFRKTANYGYFKGLLKGIIKKFSLRRDKKSEEE